MCGDETRRRRAGIFQGKGLGFFFLSRSSGLESDEVLGVRQRGSFGGES